MVVVEAAARVAGQGRGQGGLGEAERLITSSNFYVWHSRKRLGVTHTLFIHGSAAQSKKGAAITQASITLEASTASRNHIMYFRMLALHPLEVSSVRQ